MKVKFIESIPHVPLTKGKIYTVINEYDDFYSISNDVGVTGGWFKHRFELVEEPNPVVFKLGSFYCIPNTGTHTYKCCGFTSTGVPLFENSLGEPVSFINPARANLIEYVKPVEVGSKVRFGASTLIVTAIHGDYAWVHTENGSNYHGGPGGMIQRLDKLKVI